MGTLLKGIRFSANAPERAGILNQTPNTMSIIDEELAKAFPQNTGTARAKRLRRRKKPRSNHPPPRSAWIGFAPCGSSGSRHCWHPSAIPRLTMYCSPVGLGAITEEPTPQLVARIECFCFRGEGLA